MPPQKFNRTLEELREVASLFWPRDILAEEAKLSAVPKLIETQADFIRMLEAPVDDVQEIFKALEASTLPANLFVKHLTLLADFGGEMLSRVNSVFDRIFPKEGERYQIRYLYNGKKRAYCFEKLPVPSLTSDRLGISNEQLAKIKKLDPLLKDVIVILLFGSAGEGKIADLLSQCEIGRYIGQKDKLQAFINQRYIWVSRITRGSMANKLGQILQQRVITRLQTAFAGTTVEIRENNKIPGIRHGKKLTTFDIVATDGRKYVAVEVSFQVTTNSTIERKAGQVKGRFDQIDKAGWRIAYLVDGAGNFHRKNAAGTLCDHSHCDVAFSNAEIKRLVDFLKGYFGV